MEKTCSIHNLIIIDISEYKIAYNNKTGHFKSRVDLVEDSKLKKIRKILDILIKGYYTLASTSGLPLSVRIKQASASITLKIIIVVLYQERTIEAWL